MHKSGSGKNLPKKINITIPEEYIFMESISGRKAEKRHDFQRMIGLAKTKPRPFSVIIVWKYSRFARNQEESIVYKSMLKKDNVDVISVSEPLIEGPFGSLIERIIEWMDEYYSIRLSGEVLRGMKEKPCKKAIRHLPVLAILQLDMESLMLLMRLNMPLSLISWTCMIIRT